jgi:hypothetical protein
LRTPFPPPNSTSSGKGCAPQWKSNGLVGGKSGLDVGLDLVMDGLGKLGRRSPLGACRQDRELGAHAGMDPAPEPIWRSPILAT